MCACMHTCCLFQLTTEARPLEQVERGDVCHACPSGVNGSGVGGWGGWAGWLAVWMDVYKCM